MAENAKNEEIIEMEEETDFNENESGDETCGLNENEPDFYDPKADEKDAKWIDGLRDMSRCGVEKPGTSDAVLNCPLCLSLLCLDCQRHETFKTQYRAMFVVNCNVDTEKTLCYKPKKTDLNPDKEKYHPVNCGVCNTQVAVYDEDEVYHFFNIIASHC